MYADRSSDVDRYSQVMRAVDSQLKASLHKLATLTGAIERSKDVDDGHKQRLEAYVRKMGKLLSLLKQLSKPKKSASTEAETRTGEEVHVSSRVGT